MGEHHVFNLTQIGFAFFNILKRKKNTIKDLKGFTEVEDALMDKHTSVIE